MDNGAQPTNTTNAFRQFICPTRAHGQLLQALSQSLVGALLPDAIPHTIEARPFAAVVGEPVGCRL
jgi:hypothetical protein